MADFGGTERTSAMTLIASLLFATALAASIAVILLTIGNAMPRIAQVIEMEFSPAAQTERRIFFGEVKGRRSAEVIAFPLTAKVETEFRLAA
jgi:hypothetical protein